MELSSTDDQEWTKGCTLFLGRVFRVLPSQDLILHSPQCGQEAIQEAHFLSVQGGKHANSQNSVSLPLL